MPLCANSVLHGDKNEFTGVMSVGKKKKEARPFEGRRYVGTGETLAYILFDVSKDFHINNYERRYFLDVVKLNLNKLAIIKFIVGLYDAFNDPFIGAIVDKTRTRFGKFRPYLVVFSIPATITTCIYWLSPLFFGLDPNDSGKLLFWLILMLLRETGSTFRSISETGMLATITPNPMERTRLISMAQLLSGFMGERLPQILMGLLIDLVNKNVLHTTLKSVYMTMGVGTAVVSGVLSLIFFIVAKERVPQSLDRPSVIEGFKALLSNRPAMLIALSEFLGAFAVNPGVDNYYIDVLGTASIKNIVGIPGGVVAPMSYTYLQWARQRFSTKLLWIVGSSWGNILMIGVFLFGSIGGSGKNGMYRKRLPMIFAFMMQETLWTVVWSFRKVIPVEITNEAMDYGEWKNGYRSEGVTSIAMTFSKKIVNSFSTAMESALLGVFGYDLEAGFGEQSIRTQYALFGIGTILPAVLGLFGIIPKLFYNIEGELRDKMYMELAQRRQLLVVNESEKAGEESIG